MKCTFLASILLAVHLAGATPAPLPRPQTFNDVIQDLPNSNALLDDVQQGISQNWWAQIPQGVTELGNTLGIDDLLGGEREFLNIPGYGNWTGNGWSLRIHGQLRAIPFGRLDQNKQDDIAENFLPNVDYNRLQPNEQENARNLTGYILSVPVDGERVSFDVRTLQSSNGAGAGYSARIQFPVDTDSRGELDRFISLPQEDVSLPDGDVQGGVLAQLSVNAVNENLGNATGYLVPTRGITVVSDIDDILRVTRIFDPADGLLNTFARDFEPWDRMPDVFNGWARQTDPQAQSAGVTGGYHFHYLTTTPIQATRQYMEFIYSVYPQGSFDTRPLNFTTVDQTFNIRKVLLEKIFETYPERRFVLIGDTTNSDVLDEYPRLVETFPGQVACILLRNTSATEPDNKLPYNLKAFEALKQEQYMFFEKSDDIAGLNFFNGDCRNASVPNYAGGADGWGWRNVPGNGEDFLDNITGGGDNGGNGGNGGNGQGAGGRLGVTLGAVIGVALAVTGWFL